MCYHSIKECTFYFYNSVVFIIFQKGADPVMKKSVLKAVLAVLAVSMISGPVVAVYAGNSPVTYWKCYWCGATATTPARPKGSLPPAKARCASSRMDKGQHGWVRQSGAPHAATAGYYWECTACKKVVYVEAGQVPFTKMGSGCKSVKDGYHRWQNTNIKEYVTILKGGSYGSTRDGEPQ